jgi:hypothetical protein
MRFACLTHIFQECNCIITAITRGYPQIYVLTNGYVLGQDVSYPKTSPTDNLVPLTKSVPDWGHLPGGWTSSNSKQPEPV